LIDGKRVPIAEYWSHCCHAIKTQVQIDCSFFCLGRKELKREEGFVFFNALSDFVNDLGRMLRHAKEITYNVSTGKPVKRRREMNE